MYRTGWRRSALFSMRLSTRARERDFRSTGRDLPPGLILRVPIRRLSGGAFGVTRRAMSSVDRFSR